MLCTRDGISPFLWMLATSTRPPFKTLTKVILLFFIAHTNNIVHVQRPTRSGVLQWHTLLFLLIPYIYSLHGNQIVLLCSGLPVSSILQPKQSNFSMFGSVLPSWCSL